MSESPKALISDTYTRGGSSQTADPEILINYCVWGFSLQSENWWGICAYSHYTQVSRHRSYTLKAATQTVPCDNFSQSQINTDYYVYVLCMSNIFSQWQIPTNFNHQQCVLVGQLPIISISFISRKAANLEMGGGGSLSLRFAQVQSEA